MHYWIWLTNLPYIGSVTSKKLIEIFEIPENLYNTSEAELKKIKGLTLRQRNSILTNRELETAKRITERCEKCQISLISINDSQYPEKAKQCIDAPVLLYYQGRIERKKQSIGIVGARRCTQEVKNFVAELTESYAKKEVAIVSGMAKGVDSYAHTACLKAEGYTIAVLANGLDICYPSEHKKLKECIEKEGLVISEYPPGTHPTRYAFPKRNRLISAWSDELAVIAAGKGSGALITANCSKKYGRKVDFYSGIGDHSRYNFPV